METILIGIGGISLRINLPDLSSQLEDSYLPFRLHPVSAMEEWHIHSELIPETILRLESRPRTSPIRDIRRSKSNLIFRLWWQPETPSPWKAAAMDQANARADIWLNRREEETISHPLFAIDLLLFPYLLLPRDGLLIHAAAVKIGKDGYIFPAPAGGGKSTWSDLLNAHPGWIVLGEDKVIVRKIGAGYQVFGTPWNPRPKYQAPDSALLRGIFFLRPGRKNRISEIGKADAAKKLLQEASLPFQNREELDTALSIIKDIAENVPAYQFGFKPDQSSIDYFSKKNNRIFSIFRGKCHCEEHSDEAISSLPGEIASSFHSSQ